MSFSSINVVWLKRDLRTQDHEPFHKAINQDLPFAVIYLFEPSLLDRTDSSLRHLQFIYKSIENINQKLKAYGGRVNVFFGEAIEVFSFLNQNYMINCVYSYQESGTRQTWNRDKQTSDFFRHNRISWIESQFGNIKRGISNRENWDKNWSKEINKPIIFNEFIHGQVFKVEHRFEMPQSLLNDIKFYPSEFIPAGESQAKQLLESFMESRGVKYLKQISKPSLSRESCSRLSPHLAWGNITVKQVFKFVNAHKNYDKYKRNFNAFISRLKWREHFIQKFEVECEYETLCINRGYEKLKQSNDDNLLEAWKIGNTGVPIIDANMRALIKTGWINFRMRALLVSFLTHNLSQDWRRGSYHLARLFLDYEPGIHYPQMQMQAGTTGVNTIRMYNPIKQSNDHDINGVFVKKWVPELKTIPNSFLSKPWEMTTMEQLFYNIELGKKYPYPIVNIEETARLARDKIWGMSKDNDVIREQVRIIKTHTRGGDRSQS